MLVDSSTGEHFTYGHGGYVNNQTNNMAYGGDKGISRGYGIEKNRNAQGLDQIQRSNK